MSEIKLPTFKTIVANARALKSDKMAAVLNESIDQSLNLLTIAEKASAKGNCDYNALGVFPYAKELVALHIKALAQFGDNKDDKALKDLFKLIYNIGIRVSSFFDTLPVLDDRIRLHHGFDLKTEDDYRLINQPKSSPGVSKEDNYKIISPNGLVLEIKKKRSKLDVDKSAEGVKSSNEESFSKHFSVKVTSDVENTSSISCSSDSRGFNTTNIIDSNYESKSRGKTFTHKAPVVASDLLNDFGYFEL